MAIKEKPDADEPADPFALVIVAQKECADALSQLKHEHRIAVLHSLCVLFGVDTTEWEP